MYPTVRPLSPIMPEGISPVTTDEDIEKYFISYLMDGQNLSKNEHYKYATWIAGGGYKVPFMKMVNCEDEIGDGIWVVVPNQVQWCIDHYKSKGFGNNHSYIQVGYPESSLAYDIPYKNELERQTSPCLRGIDTKIIKEGETYSLNFHAYFRSWDLYGAWPENMGGITLLMEYMANELGIEPGTLSFSAMKLHCYKHALEVVKQRLSK